MDIHVLSVLVGLTGAIQNNGKTAETDHIVMEAILSDDTIEAVNKLREEKSRIAPDCAACAAPCGNTSDYDVSAFEELPEEMKEIKRRVMTEISLYVRRIADSGGDTLSEVVYKAIAYLGYDLSRESYENLIEEINNG